MKSMRNQHIKNLGEEVPIDIRLDVYERALNFYKSKGGIGLCISLPMKLWGLHDSMHLAPDGNYWYWRNTPLSFPELTREVLDSISYETRVDSDELRIKYLKEWIVKLKDEINEKSTH